MKKTPLCVFAVLVFTISSCNNTSLDEFFSTSLAKPQAYDASKINVTAGNVDDLVKSARGNPALAEAITQKIIDDLRNNRISETDKPKLMEAAMKLAVQSSGLGTSIITQASSALGDLNNLTDGSVPDILRSISADFNSGSRGSNAAANLSTITYFDITGKGKDEAPQFGSGYANNAKPGDVAEAIMILTLAELGSDIDDWDNPSALGLYVAPGSGIVTVTEDSPSPNQVALAAYLNLIAADKNKNFSDNPLTSTIQKAFNLIR